MLPAMMEIPAAAQAATTTDVAVDHAIHGASGNVDSSNARWRYQDKLIAAVTALYQDNHTLMWSHDGRLTSPARQLLTVMNDADTYGLDPNDYAATSLDDEVALLESRQQPVPERWREFDMELSLTAGLFINDLHYGRITPRRAGFDLHPPRNDLDIAAFLQQLAVSTNVSATLSSIEPAFEHYRLLKATLQHYRTLAVRSASLPPLAALHRKSIREGDGYADAPALREWLSLLNDFPGKAGPSTTDELHMDHDLVLALQHFQQRHGLTPDGVLGRQTMAALKVPLSFRVRQIELTLERWRWLPAFSTPPIIVNIPQFRLFAMNSADDNGNSVLRMDVIVGKNTLTTRTPVFVSEIRQVVFRPYWDIPKDIAINELLPLHQLQPDYFLKHHYELVHGEADASPVVPVTTENLAWISSGEVRVRQQPGKDNALGDVKFVIRGSYNIYLHATPDTQLFNRPQRAFSHGCIRVSDPVALALYVLRNESQHWTADDVATAFNGAINQRVTLMQPVQVMILYGTVAVNSSGEVFFMDDVYGLDRKLERLLHPKSATHH